MRGAGMEGDRRGAAFGEFRCPAVRILNHQMNVDRQVRHFADALDDWLPKGQVRYEMMVHNINVDEIRIGDGLEVSLKVAEISG